MKKALKIHNMVIEISNYMSLNIPNIFVHNRFFESQMDEFNDGKMLRSSGIDRDGYRSIVRDRAFVCPAHMVLLFFQSQRLCLLVK